MTAERTPRLKVAPESEHRLREKLKAEFRRARGRNLDRQMQELRPLLIGWSNYFRHAPVKATFEEWRGPSWKLPAPVQIPRVRRPCVSSSRRPIQRHNATLLSRAIVRVAPSLPALARGRHLPFAGSARAPTDFGDLLAETGFCFGNLHTDFGDFLPHPLCRLRDVTQEPFLQQLEQMLFLILVELAQHLHQGRGRSVAQALLQRAWHRKHSHGSGRFYAGRPSASTASRRRIDREARRQDGLSSHWEGEQVPDCSRTLLPALPRVAQHLRAGVICPLQVRGQRERPVQALQRFVGAAQVVEGESPVDPDVHIAGVEVACGL